ncbi:hypothetical protein AGMMS49944_05610 [Spirochaetia bacterium]|nr:hypothetical protein AGMMS49944_05610 [Spirochaetia bacterium]
MEENGVFNRLAAALPMDERKSLLEKLGAQAGTANQPLYNDADSLDAAGPMGPADLKKKYAALPWYSRLFFWFAGLFRGKPPIQMFLNQQIARLGRLIEEQSPGIYDYEHDLLLPAFHRKASNLKESARFFYDALDMSVNRDKGAFYAFLASLEIEDIHRRLLAETDPQRLAERHPDADNAVLRALALEAMDECITSITDEQRAVMYYNVRTLHYLKELSAFLFDRLLVSFSIRKARQGAAPQENGLACSAHLVNNYLRNLNNILYSLKDAPPLTLLESLFIFILQDKAGTPEFNMEEEMTALLTQAQQALTVIRTFNKTVPLNRILRCAEKDMSILPKPVSGGEDWFSLYKEYWKHTVEEQFNVYLYKRRKEELMADFRDFFKSAKLQAVNAAAITEPKEGIPLQGAFGLSFLKAFHSAVFLPDLDPVLRPLLKESRAEFSEAYNTLFKIDTHISRFKGDVSDTGELGKRYAAALMDMSSLSVKRHKLQLVENEAADEAAKISGHIRNSLISMVRVLGGILTESPDDSVSIAIKTLTRTLELMDKITVMEAG